MRSCVTVTRPFVQSASFPFAFAAARIASAAFAASSYFCSETRRSTSFHEALAWGTGFTPFSFPFGGARASAPPARRTTTAKRARTVLRRARGSVVMAEA